MALEHLEVDDLSIGLTVAPGQGDRGTRSGPIAAPCTDLDEFLAGTELSQVGVVHGGGANGLIAWKDREGRTLKELESG